MVFSRKFLAFSQLLRQGPRMLPSSAAELSAARSLEERADALITNQRRRNGQLLAKSWFAQVFDDASLAHARLRGELGAAAPHAAAPRLACHV